MTYSPLPEHLAQPKPATEHTRHAQERVQQALDFSDRQSFEDAKRGFIASLDPITIQRPDGHVTYDLEHMGFLDAEAPATVNPSLWRQAQLNAQHHGLFEVCDGLYQVRSFRHRQHDADPRRPWLDHHRPVDVIGILCGGTGFGQRTSR